MVLHFGLHLYIINIVLLGCLYSLNNNPTYTIYLVLVLTLLILFLCPGFFAVLGVLGMVRQPSVEITVCCFRYTSKTIHRYTSKRTTIL